MKKRIPGFKTLVIISFLFMPILGKAQTDTTRYPIFDLYLETGVHFLGNDNFNNVYNSKSTINWSFGTKIGSSYWKYLPWIKFSQYQLEIDSIILKDINEDDLISAKRNQLSAGIINPIKIKDNNYLQLKLGISYNFISEELTDLYSEPVGLLMSVGYMKKISKVMTYYVDFGYDYVKTDRSKLFKDWSGVLINFGISFNPWTEEE